MAENRTDRTIGYTISQQRRFKELGADPLEPQRSFSDPVARDLAFRQWEQRTVRCERKRLQEYRTHTRRPGLCRLQDRLTTLLLSCGFAQVVTPIVMAKGMLNKMGLDNAHPLFSQIFWLNSKQCLRPMLAPHLYYLIKDLLRLWEKPIQIFEVGPCFRKESRGATHSNEFTMVNLTEFGLAEEDRIERIQELAIRILETIEIEEYRFETSSSEVYGETIDVLAGPNEVEVASCAMGPHPLDQNWRLHECWIGLGFGLERLLLAKAAHANISKMGRSLSYLDGIRLNI